MIPEFPNTNLRNTYFAEVKKISEQKPNKYLSSKNRTTMNPLIEKARAHCYRLIEQSRCSKLPFHNWEHTQNVVRNVKEISSAEKIDLSELNLLVLAAYFHDVGHVKEAENHEKISCQYADDFLEKNGCNKENIKTVQNIIMTTVMPQNPQTELQRIICDADLAHLGKVSFGSQNEKLRREWSYYGNAEFSDREWFEMNIHFLERHSFHTEFAKKHFTNQKTENIEILKSLI